MPALHLMGLALITAFDNGCPRRMRVSLCVYVRCAYLPVGTRRGHWRPQSQSYRELEATCSGCWELSPLEEQEALVAAASSQQPPVC